MNTQQRGNFAIGVLLLLVGGWFLAAQLYPPLNEIIQIEYAWPVWVIGVGVTFLLLAILARVPGLAVPAAIITGIGALLYYQNQTGDFASWAYAWTLIPGFVGVGVFLASLLEGRIAYGFKEMLRMLFFSAVMFGICGSFLGGPAYLSDYWPVLLIVIGVWILGRGLLNPRTSAAPAPEAPPGKNKVVEVVEMDEDTDWEEVKEE